MLKLVHSNEDAEVQRTLQDLRAYIELCSSLDNGDVYTEELLKILFRNPEAGDRIIDNKISIEVNGNNFSFNFKEH